ncbi:MAG TPA: aldo/keto reductase [Thermoplasmata archaeon]|nr:aldo/keto reductase [Thermoplasmata archaeon]
MTTVEPLRLDSRVRTGQGLELPRLGLGVFQTPPGTVTRKAVAWALAAGYRLIDTAAMYGNEADVGEAVRASGIPRDEIVVTTKLWFTDHGFDAAQAAARKSRDRLGLGPIDLYLIHWPRADPPEARLASWKALEKLREEGTVRTIGVSNYAVRHLEELRATSGVAPSVDQVELHPYVYDPEFLQYADRHRIVVEAYSPLTRGRKLDAPAVAAVARAHGKSAAQVLLRWGLQHGLVELPKSVHEERIRENADLYDFALTPEEVAALDRLRGGGRVGATDPATIP